MAKPIAIAILANGQQASREFESLGAKAAKWGKRVAAAGGIAALALTKTVVNAASDAQQSLGATEQIYGKYADTVIKRSEKAADAIGLSANEYRELSNVTGAMLKSSGMPLKQVTDLTDKLNRRAADMAATFGGTTREAVEAVSSLLRGEADPIERYGVSIKQSDVNARLAAKGLDKLEGAARKQAEQQERLALLFDQSKDSAGQFARESGTLAGQQQRLTAKLDNLKVRVGNVLLPMFTKAAEGANKHLVPALEDAAHWFEENSDEIGAFGKKVGSTLLPVLKTTVGLVKDAVEVTSGLPDPIKSIGVQAGIAALILPRLTAAAAATSGALATTTARTKQFYAELTYAETRGQRVGAVMEKLGGAARTAAGVGGMVALTQSTQTSNDALSTLLATAGGAATGFAVGGPWGAAIGGAAGLLGGLWQAASKASDGFSKGRPPASDYASTLNEITGAATKATRELIYLDLQQSGAITAATNLGVSHRDLIRAVQGNADAYGRVTRQMSRTGMVSQETKDAMGVLGKYVGDTTSDYNTLRSQLEASTQAFREDTRATRAKALATQNLSKVFKGVPRKVITRIEQLGFEPSLKQLARLQRRYDLTPKQLRTIIKATDADVSAKKVEKYNAQLARTGKTKPSPQWEKAYRGMLTGAETSTRRTNETLASTLNRGISSSRSTARSGAEGIGGDLKAGMPAGFAGADGLWAAEVRRAVSAAISAGRQEAQTRSPSRKTAKLGRDLADGLVIGMLAKQKKVKSAAQKLLGNALSGITGGSGGINRALDQVTKRIEKRVKGKKEEKREKRILKALRDEYKALQRNGKAQDQISAKLENQRRVLAERVQAARDAAAAILAGVRAYAGVTSVEEGHLNSPRSLVDQMTARVENAERFADLIQQLTGKLNKTSLQELIDKGVEGGLAAAEALAAGGQSTIDQVNALQKRLDKAGTTLGATAVNQFHQAGINAAQGLVNGLLAKEANLDKAAKRLAKKLVKAIKKELGIKSPSRVGKELGGNFAGSIDLGAKVIPLDRTGRLLARDLVRGFGEPTMTARAAWEATRATAGQPVRLEFDVHLTADQLSAVEQGRRATAHITAYQRAGGLTA